MFYVISLYYANNKEFVLNFVLCVFIVDEFHFTNEMEFETFLDEATSNLPLIQPLQTSEFRRGLSNFIQSFF